MIEDDLRAAFARHEAEIPPTGPLRTAINRAVVRRRRRQRRFQVGGAALAVAGLLGVAVPHLAPERNVDDATLLAERRAQAPAGALNVLLVGLDSVADQQPPMADSVLLLHLPADRSRPYLISLPRDLTVSIPGYPADKLNSAFAHGAGDGRPDLAGGYQLTRRTVEDLTGVRIAAGVVLTYPVLRKLTDAVDGVEVCLPGEVDSIHTRRVFRAGCQHLDGAASVDLLRQRRGLPDGSLDRDRHAQLFAAGLLRRADEQGVLTNPVRLFRLVEVVGPGLITDRETSLPDLAAVIPDLRSLDPVGLSLPIGPPPGLPYSLAPDPQAAPAFLAALREDRLAQWAAAHPDRVNRTR